MTLHEYLQLCLELDAYLDDQAIPQPAATPPTAAPVTFFGRQGLCVPCANRAPAP